MTEYMYFFEYFIPAYQYGHLLLKHVHGTEKHIKSNIF